MGDFKPEHEGWLYKDVERAQERSAELAEMSDAQRVGLLRAELAAMEADYEVQQENYDAALEELDAARARIAELEHDLLHGHESGPIRSMRARAEQAEKRVGELEAALVLVREVNASLDARAEQIELANKEFGDQLAHAHVQLAEERARAEHAEARIAELEELRVTETHKWVIAETRAERAEAERDAIKSVLERVVAKCPKLEPVCIAAVGLTALNPSPAEKDIRC